MSACLFIGLGGNGLKILSSLKKQLQKEGIISPNDVAYLGIDIGGQDIPDNLNQNEIINISEGDVNRIINSDFYWNYLQKWWFDRSYVPYFRYAQGAWQLRLLGRLALFYKGSEIINRISRIFTDLQGNGVEIFVISSTSGGTGAGIFFDMPALLNQTPNLPNNNSVYGFLLNYDIVNQFNTKDSDAAIRSKKNAAALLTELDIVTLKKPVFSFQINNPNDANQPYNLNLNNSYRWIFIQTLNNEDGSRLDNIEDYYELASLLLKNSFYISNNNVGGKSWSGIENSIGQMLNILTQSINSTITTKSGKTITYQLPLQIVRKYIGFGGFVIEFPEDEIREYLKIKTLNEVFNELKNSSLSHVQRDNFINNIISEIQESQNQDKLLTKIDTEIIKSATNQKKLLLSANKAKLIQNLSNELINSQNVSSFINSLNVDLNLVLSGASTSLPKIFQQIYKNTIDKIDQGLVNNNQYNLIQKLILVKELILSINYELEDYSKTEKTWSEKINENVAYNALITEMNKYNDYMKSVTKFQEIFNKSDVQATKESHLNNIAISFVNTYFKTLKLKISNNHIITLYSNLINYLQIEKQKIESNLNSFENYIKHSSFYFPNELQNVIHTPNEADFHIKVAKVKSIVDKYIYAPNVTNLFQNIRIGGIINFTDLDNLINTIENNIRLVLQNFTLDKGLELEAEYFIKELPIIIDSGIQGGISQFENLIDFAKKSSETEKNLFYGRYKDYFDTNSLINVINIINILKSNVIDGNILNKCIDELVTGRLTLIYNRWNSCFAELINIPGINLPPKYCAFKINTSSNVKTTSFFTKNIKGQHTVINNNSSTRLDFVNFNIGFALAQLEQFSYGLRDVESTRIKTNFSYFKSKKFENPDSTNIYHNDKRFLENIDLLNYSPLVVPVINEKIENCWKLIILLLALDYLDTSNYKFSKVLFDIDNLKLFDKDLVFKTFDELFRMLYLFDNSDIDSLTKKLENEIKSNSDKINLLKNAEDYFVNNNLFDELIPYIKEYIELLKK